MKTQKWAKKILIATGLLVVTLLHQNCDPVHEDELNQGSQGEEKSIAAFTKTLHPVLQTKCGSCHGASQAPTFAVADAKTAHGLILSAQLVSFSNIENSDLVKKVDEGHQGFDTTDGDEIGTEISDWHTQSNN